MQSRVRLGLGLALALAATLGARPALAQPAPISKDLPITTIENNRFSGQSVVSDLVVTNRTDYDKLFPNGAPASPTVDFANEDVLACSLGSVTYGNTIEITRVNLQTGGFTGGMAFVTVEERSLPPGTIVPMVMTAPRHVVKVPKGAYRYVFNRVKPAAATFDALSLTWNSSPVFGKSWTLNLYPNGDCRLMQAAPNIRYMPISGTATTAELKAATDAFKNARVETLPAAIKDPNVYIMAPATISLTSEVAGKSYGTTATHGQYAPYDSRVAPLVAALTAIADRLKAPPAAPFEKISLNYSGGLVIYSDLITCDKNGLVVIKRTGFRGTPSRYVSGRASAAEIKAVVDAVNGADVPSLPKTINDPILIMDVPSVTITTTLGTQDFVTGVLKAGFYGSYDARVRPLVDAVRAISNRLMDSAGQLVRGQVTWRGGRLHVGGYLVSGNQPLHPTLARVAGKTVAVYGIMGQSGSVQTLEVKSIVGKTTARVNFRTRASLSSTVIRTLPVGQALEVTGVSGSFFSVKVGAEAGWCWSDYVSITQ